MLDAQCKTNHMVGEEEPTEKVEIFLTSCMPHLYVSLKKSLKVLISALHTGCVCEGVNEHFNSGFSERDMA